MLLEEKRRRCGVAIDSMLVWLRARGGGNAVGPTRQISALEVCVATHRNGSLSAALHGDALRPQWVGVSMFVTGRPLESVCVSPNAAEGENEAGVLVGPPAASPKTGWDGMGWKGTGTGEARQTANGRRCADFATRQQQQRQERLTVFTAVGRIDDEKASARDRGTSARRLGNGAAFNGLSINIQFNKCQVPSRHHKPIPTPFRALRLSSPERSNANKTTPACVAPWDHLRAFAAQTRNPRGTPSRTLRMCLSILHFLLPA